MNESLSPDWQKLDGLMPAIVQDARTGQFLMLGYMNEAALDRTRQSEQVTFFSRSRQQLWTKGETSGHVLNLVSMALDCDRDTLLVQAIPEGPTCHLGTQTCWGDDCRPAVGFLGRLEQVIASRRNAPPESSYTARLLDAGTRRCAQKVGEEGVEVALAASAGDRDELIDESADLLYHLLVTLAARDVDFDEVCERLQSRHA